MPEHLKEVEKMIAKVMAHRDCNRAAATAYMLTVATGRLLALKRYESTLPEGKKQKGILTLVGRKKRAEKTPALTLAAADDKPAKPAKTPKPPKPKRKRKPKPEQTELVAAEE